MKRWPLALFAACTLAYVVWLGAHWLPLDYSDKEFAGFVSRLWDLQREWEQHRQLAWWTPFYMSGSSYGLHHSQGLYLPVAWLLAQWVDPLTAVKLTASLAIAAGGLAMFGCARYLIGAHPFADWAAWLAGMAFLLHPQQVIRAAGAEHLGVMVFLPFIPLSWWAVARLLDRGRWVDMLAAAAAVAGSMWAHNKMAFVNLLFLAGYLGYRIAIQPAAERLGFVRAAVGRVVGAGLLAALLGAFFILPGLWEARYVKLFRGDPFAEWQRSYSFKSLFGVLDRDGVLTRQTIHGVLRPVETRGGVRTQQELDDVRRVVGLQMESPEKYAGLVWLGGVVAVAGFAYRRQNRSLLLFVGGAWIFGWMCAHGPSNVWSAHSRTLGALMRLDGVPMLTRVALWLVLGGVVGFVAWLGWRRLTSRSARVALAVAGAVVLFLPAFRVVSALPFFREIRAPFVFYDLHSAFFGALMMGFLVTDVVRARVAVVAGAVAFGILLDYWPYQRPCKTNGVPESTLANLRAVYQALRPDPEPVKVYALSGRYFHLLGPMWSGKPQAWEAFYNWMAPRGLGDLVAQAGGDPTMLRVVGARYVVFDKSDPSMAGAGGMLDAYRKLFPVKIENDDFVVFRHAQPVGYVTGFARAWAAVGDSMEWVRPALALANSGRVLIAADRAPDGNRFERVCRLGEPFNLPIQALPPLALSDVQVERRSAHEIRLSARTAEPGWLVIAESWYPFWQAARNGEPVTLHRAFQGLMAVELPVAGAHQIELRYRPPTAYRVAMGVSAVSWLGALAGCAWTRRRATAR